MPVQLAPPSRLDHLTYFLVRYHRESQKYELLEPHSTNSFELGDARTARKYFEDMGLEYLGGRALDSALAFGMSQAWIKAQRAYGLDLCKTNVEAGRSGERDIDEERRLLDGEDGDDDFPFVSGTLSYKG